jgi:predicted DNA-binding protein (UPF0251 family)
MHTAGGNPRTDRMEPMPGDRMSASERLRLAERRRQALHLHSVRQLSIGEIAQVLQVSARTVNRDLKSARAKAKEQLEKQAESAERLSDLAHDIDANYVAAQREAWGVYHASSPSSAGRVRALNTVITATDKRAEHLRALGLLRQVPGSLALGLSMFGLTDQELAEQIKQLEGTDDDDNH